MINGSRGPMLRKATSLDWVGDPFDVSKFVALHGEDTYEQFLAHYQEYTDVVGDHFLNLVATTLPLNAYLLDNEPKYKRWLVDYMDAWLARMKKNGGIIPSYVALDGTIGGPEGKWWNNAYGWGFSPVNPVSETARGSEPHSACDGRVRQRAAGHGRSKDADAWRAMIDAVNAHARTVDRRTEYPTMHGERRLVWLEAHAVERRRARAGDWSMKREDRPRTDAIPWIEYLRGQESRVSRSRVETDL